GAGEDDRQLHPAEQEAAPRPQGAAEVDDVAAVARVGGGQFGVAQRADEREQAGGAPGDEGGGRVAGVLEDERSRLVDAGPDDDADDDADGVPQPEHGPGLGGGGGVAGRDVPVALGEAAGGLLHLFGGKWHATSP